MVLPALKRGGYSYRKQVLVGSRPGGGRHKVDLAARKSAPDTVISINSQFWKSMKIVLSSRGHKALRIRFRLQTP